MAKFVTTGQPAPISPPVKSDGTPIYALDGPSDPQDKKPVVVISPATEGWNTWISGAQDDGYNGVRGGGGPFKLEFLDINLPQTQTMDLDFMENLEIHDGQVAWEPISAWGSDDKFSLGVHIPATVATVNVSSTGNANLVPTGLGYNVIVPALGDGGYDVDLDDVAPIPADDAGYWNADYTTGDVSPSATPGAAEFHLLDIPITSWMIRNVLMTHPGGWFDIDVYKTEWFHHNWKLRWEVTKNTIGDGKITGWILAFRKNTQ